MESRESKKIEVHVVYALPRMQQEVSLCVPLGSTVKDAVVASGLEARFNLFLETLRVGIWGEETALDTPVKSGDRVEIYRSLQMDPKLLRKQRAASQKKHRLVPSPSMGEG